MEIQRAKNSHDNLKKENQKGRTCSTRYQDNLKVLTTKVALAQGKTNGLEKRTQKKIHTSTDIQF